MLQNKRGLESLALMILALLATPNGSRAPSADADIKWTPKPFVFERGDSVRYVDFENGNDANPGTKAQPWKHHPWDKNATGKSAACKGVHTYCFRKGVVYRGALAHLLHLPYQGVRCDPLALLVGRNLQCQRLQIPFEVINRRHRLGCDLTRLRVGAGGEDLLDLFVDVMQLHRCPLPAA